MGDSLQGGPVRLAILLASIAGMVVLGVKTAGGSDASASHGTAHGQPGIIVAAPARGSIPAEVGQRLGALPHKRGAAAVATGGTIYLLGGTQRTAHSGRIPVGSVLRIDGPGERTRVAKLPTPVTGAAAAAVGDRLYAIGGRLANGKTTNEVQEYDVATEHSVIAARLPEGVAQASAVTLDGFVYVLGGDAGGGPSASILRFDPWADAVAPAGRLPAPLVGGAAAAFRPHHAYLVGATGPGGAHAAYSLILKPGRG
jgi:hypothetical protein